MTPSEPPRPPLPPFDVETAAQKVRIAVRFAYNWHDDSGSWFRSYGNENWEFDDQGFMRRRIASINDLPIAAADRKYHWPLGRRPTVIPGSLIWDCDASNLSAMSGWTWT